MKKAFTLSEALVTLAIIGVLAAILIPVVSNVRPDKDKITYKKALYTMQNAMSNAMDSTTYTMASNSAAYWKDDTIADDDFCKAIADSLNIVGNPNCDCGTDSSYDNPNFITTDGIRYWGLECRFDGDTREIFVDRKLSPNEINAVAKFREQDPKTGLKIKVRYDGRITTDENSDYENELIEDGLSVHQKSRGSNP